MIGVSATGRELSRLLVVDFFGIKMIVDEFRQGGTLGEELVKYVSENICQFGLHSPSVPSQSQHLVQ